jgi:hypothetical protein
MMRYRKKTISLLAALGMLLHAGFLVHHHQSMLEAAFDHLALSFDGGIICRGGHAGGEPSSGVPAPSGKLPNCPICTGAMASAAIVPPAIEPATLAFSRPSIHIALVDQRINRRSSDIRPPTRAPPLTI